MMKPTWPGNPVSVRKCWYSNWWMSDTLMHQLRTGAGPWWYVFVNCHVFGRLSCFFKTATVDCLVIVLCFTVVWDFVSMLRNILCSVVIIDIVVIRSTWLGERIWCIRQCPFQIIIIYSIRDRRNANSSTAAESGGMNRIMALTVLAIWTIRCDPKTRTLSQSVVLPAASPQERFLIASFTAWSR